MVSELPISNEPTIPISTMSSSSSETPTLTLNTQPSSATDQTLIALNISAQINEKLTPSTFPQWRAQFEALLIGYGLLDYVEGTLPCPPSTGTSADDLRKTHWVRQDKLILSAILASTSSSITPLIATAKTSHGAWTKLNTLYASRSRTRAMQLKEELTLIQRGNRPIPDYLHAVKALADEIAVIDHPISDDDLTLYVLNGLGADFREIAGPIRARESSLTFEELHDLLVGHEAYLRRLEAATQHLVASANYTKTKQGGSTPWSSKPNGPAPQRWSQGSSPNRHSHGAQRDGRRSNHQSGRPNNSNRRYQPKCQLCDQLGHTAKYCSQFNSQHLSANCATTSSEKDKTWLLDSAASHNITGDLSNLSIHSEYDGTDEVILGDGSAQPYFSPSNPAPPLPNQTAQSTHHCLPLFFEAPLAVVPPSTLSGVPPSPPLQEGAAAIVAQSSGNSETPSGALLPNCLHALGSIPPSHACLGEFSSSLPLISPNSSAAASPPSSPNPDSPPIPEIPNPPQRTHQMTTRSMNQIFKPKQLHTVSKYPLPQPIEPTSVSQAVSQPHWREAMSNELTALMKHGTWDLILPPSHCKPVGCKWVFRVKRKADGSVDRFKARLVAKGYNQRPGVDYKDTFSPVVKPATIRAVLSIAVMNGWSLRQMDVNNAFLNGELTETVFMEQPPGFKDLSKPNHVCRLKKAIYGLKQAPRAWYTALKNAILQLGFSNSKADSSLFIYSQGSTLCYFLVYVDDLVITGNNSLFVTSIIKRLGDMFSLKDMGSLHFFLGVEVIPTPAGLFLSQHKYIRELLAKTSMSGAKDVSTPLSTTQSLQLIDGTAAVDSSEFRRILGSLQYLSLTHPDISFAVNKLSQFMHKPTSNHWTAIKRLLRYLKQTIFHGIQITNTGPPVLRTYSDADWAGNIDDRTSTSAYISFLGSNPISWSSKKQRAVARSTTEAEYRALATAASETMWLSILFKELNFPVKDSPQLLCDNLGATHLSFNPVNHSRMKHIQIDLHFVRDLVQKGSLQVRHVHTQDQLADLLTKPLSRQRTELLRTKIGLADGSSILRGRIREECVNHKTEHV
uniref:Reverse transcriptase Ty1/copia-type domain-containing protein n=1 Tax=Fagus sylvatica TaxID=28930 RepID=A0A2N9I0C7_FAGSY